MVKIDYSLEFFNGGELAFFIDNYATLDEINEKAVDYALDTMMNNAEGTKNVMPVLYKEDIDSEPKLIGRIAMLVVDSEVVVEHLTLDSDVINGNWNVIDFYNGTYGLVSA
ncbi:hypothetical protein [Photobacterium damselae]|uniref:hypothetical protein n=1 Tax=Photobacterium damselae TaxID=38293 RepID=UPI0015A3136E|nr:hypothetical protein [Photobacterium damselae]NVO59958.1 hypothetical protein [Photobacterium damselae subsp. damselae]